MRMLGQALRGRQRLPWIALLADTAYYRMLTTLASAGPTIMARAVSVNKATVITRRTVAPSFR